MLIGPYKTLIKVIEGRGGQQYSLDIKLLQAIRFYYIFRNVVMSLTGPYDRYHRVRMN